MILSRNVLSRMPKTAIENCRKALSRPRRPMANRSNGFFARYSNALANSSGQFSFEMNHTSSRCLKYSEKLPTSERITGLAVNIYSGRRVGNDASVSRLSERSNTNASASARYRLRYSSLTNPRKETYCLRTSSRSRNRMALRSR